MAQSRNAARSYVTNLYARGSHGVVRRSYTWRPWGGSQVLLIDLHRHKSSGYSPDKCLEVDGGKLRPAMQVCPFKTKELGVVVPLKSFLQWELRS